MRTLRWAISPALALGITTIALLTLAADGLAIARASTRHPGHESRAEVDWNPATRCFEVSIRVSSFELERALRARGERYDLEDLAAIYEYVDLAFRVFDPSSGGPAGMRPLGFEDGPAVSWIHAEFPVRAAPWNCRVANLLFFDLHPDQRNSLVHRSERGPRALVFDVDHLSHRLAGFEVRALRPEESEPRIGAVWSRLAHWAKTADRVVGAPKDAADDGVRLAITDLWLAAGEIERARAALRSIAFARKSRPATVESAIALRVALIEVARGRELGILRRHLAQAAPHSRRAVRALATVPAAAPGAGETASVDREIWREVLLRLED